MQKRHLFLVGLGAKNVNYLQPIFMTDAIRSYPTSLKKKIIVETQVQLVAFNCACQSELEQGIAQMCEK